ncbi:hypothetical protein [Nakamurella deserti]|uniref:hypothetical protein n=1 Tax=Nakamurella deserti TaxID=2164074 RepID=UPI0014784BA1|nr:hypothetical protein [Nakamurella deserti]
MTTADSTPETNDPTGGQVPNPETGAGIGASDEPNTMEPEENPEAVDLPTP